jgi:hypothetical protein
VDSAIVTAVGSLALAALSAVTFVAYKHPNAYVVLYGKLSLIVGILFFGAFAWDMSNIAATQAIQNSKLPFDKMLDARTVVEGAAISPWWILVFFAVNGWLYFLSTFPKWLLDKEALRTESRQELPSSEISQPSKCITDSERRNRTSSG